MPIYLVAYDLINERGSHDYQPLWDHLEALGAHKTQYSMWLVNVSDSPQELANHFKQYVDKDDRIWVTRVRRGQYGYTNAIKGTNDWLTSNPPD